MEYHKVFYTNLVSFIFYLNYNNCIPTFEFITLFAADILLSGNDTNLENDIRKILMTLQDITEFLNLNILKLNVNERKIMFSTTQLQKKRIQSMIMCKVKLSQLLKNMNISN